MRRNERAAALPPPPAAAGVPWRFHAACRGADPSLFFGADGERPVRRRARERQAKAICAVCPVIQPCRSYALARGEPFGVWGGLGERERRQLRCLGATGG